MRISQINRVFDKSCSHLMIINKIETSNHNKEKDVKFLTLEKYIKIWKLSLNH
jgi:hypothetical protein